MRKHSQAPDKRQNKNSSFYRPCDTYSSSGRDEAIKADLNSGNRTYQACKVISKY